MAFLKRCARREVREEKQSNTAAVYEPSIVLRSCAEVLSVSSRRMKENAIAVMATPLRNHVKRDRNEFPAGASGDFAGASTTAGAAAATGVSTAVLLRNTMARVLYGRTKRED